MFVLFSGTNIVLPVARAFSAATLHWTVCCFQHIQLFLFTFKRSHFLFDNSTKNPLATEVLNDFYRSRNVFDVLRDSRKTQHELNLFAIEDMQHLVCLLLFPVFVFIFFSNVSFFSQADLRVSLLQPLLEFLERVQAHLLSLPVEARRAFRLTRQQPVDSAQTSTTTSADQSKTSASVGNFVLTPMHIRAITMAFESRKNTDNIAGRFIYSGMLQYLVLFFEFALVLF
jgi:hypothetical protein